MNRFLSVLLIGVCLQTGPSSVCRAQSNDEKTTVDSFKGYVQRHFESYKTNRRERVTKLNAGWAKEYFEPDITSAEIDVQRTTSLISPYTGKLEFRIIRHFTAFHQSREEALADTAFPKTDVVSHIHNYAYQDGRWVPKVRQHWMGLFDGRRLYDCTEVITTGPDAGETDIIGCMEEYDDIKQ
jgi:hypothetical protein